MTHAVANMAKMKRSLRSLGSAPGFEAFVLDQLAGLGGVTSRKMFGGVGLYCGGVFFGIIARDELYLKVDEQTRGRYEAAGKQSFKPYGDRPMTMEYYAVPVGILESVTDLEKWARDAVQAAETTGRSQRRTRKSAAEEQ